MTGRDLKSNDNNKNSYVTGNIVISEKYNLRSIWRLNRIESVSVESENLILISRRHSENSFASYVFLRSDGSMAKDVEFQNVTKFADAYLCSVSGVEWGILNSNLEEVIPMEYSFYEWYDFGDEDDDERIILKKNRRWFMVNTALELKPVGIGSDNPEYEEIEIDDNDMIWTRNMTFLEKRKTYFTEHRPGLWGLCDEEGREIIPPSFLFTGYFNHGTAFVCKGKWEDGNWDNPPGSGYWSKEMFWGGIDKYGNEIVPFIYDEIDVIDCDDSLFKFHIGGWGNGKTGIMNSSGKWIVDPIFDDIGFYEGEGLFSFYEFGNVDYPLAGIYDMHNHRVLIEPQYFGIEYEGGDVFEAEYINDEGKFSIKYVNSSNEDVKPPSYLFGKGKTKDALEEESDEKKEIVTGFDFLGTGGDLLEVAKYKGADASWGLVTKDGEIVVPLVNNKYIKISDTTILFLQDDVCTAYRKDNEGSH